MRTYYNCQDASFSIADVKITLPDDPEVDVKEIRELLDGSGGNNDS